MTNIEFKARLRNPTAILQVLSKYGITLAATLNQTDTYFQVKRGRLKLREIDGEAAQLIFYRRPDRAEVKRSDYHIATVPSAAAIGKLLHAALGIRAVVKKRRELYLLPRKMMGHTNSAETNLIRLHLDTVDGLGQFLELEVLVNEGESPELAHEEARAWANEFCIEVEDFISGSYADLLESQMNVARLDTNPQQ